MLKLKIDLTTEVPAYRQLKDQLRSQVLNGSLDDCGKLLPMRKMAKMAGVSLGSIERVINELAKEGLFVKRPRSGIYVSSRLRNSQQMRIFRLSNIPSLFTNDYSRMLLKLDNMVHYPECKFFYRTITDEQIANEVLLRDELTAINREKPDCLLINIAGISRKMVYEILGLPFPVLFIGDFQFGELHDPRLNQIREDTRERGAVFIQSAVRANCRSGTFLFSDHRDNYYGILFREGAVAEAKKHGFKLNFIIPSKDEHTYQIETGELYEIRRNLLSEALKTGKPDAFFFDYTLCCDHYIRALKEFGMSAGHDIQLISNMELLSGGIFLQPDFSQSAEVSAEIIKRLCREQKKYHPGIITLTGKITYKILKIKQI